MNKKRILVAIDLSEQSQSIVAHACDLAKTSESTIHLLYVTPSLSGTNPETEHHVREQLSVFVAQAAKNDIPVEQHVSSGIPHRKIVEFAASHAVDLIVMGTHGRTGLTHFALGSVAERVIRNASCPVQVVKSHKPQTPRLDHALEILSSAEDSYEGTFAEARNRILNTLEADETFDRQLAAQTLDELEKREWVFWNSDQTGPPTEESHGKWEFVAGIEFVEVPEGDTPREDRKPAIDLILRANSLRATDIHIDPVDASESRVRFRIDGKMSEYCRMSRDAASQLVNQWKTMADLDISDPFHTKEGRLEFPPTIPVLRNTEARITTAPVHGGEAVAVRLSSRANLFIPLSDLGLDEGDLEAVNGMLRRGEGLILVTGPTGSGKTTTVYSMLETISSSEINIVSVEDPVEYSVPFVRQMEIQPRRDATMASGLKTMLRMDPDVIFLGEIRDDAAAEMAMRAASSGQYVFSTLHTRDVSSAITALRDLGLDDRSLAPNITGILNQRLLRRLCVHCRKQVETSEETRTAFREYGIPPSESVFLPNGCAECRGTGYHGRVGVFEAYAMSDESRECIAAGAPESELRKLIRAQGTTSLNADALRKVADGVTDLNEAMRVRWVV